MIAIRDCSFFDADVGIQCGGGQEKTDSELLIERTSFNNCDTAFKLNQSQNLNYLFTMLVANHCKTVINADAGGGVNVQSAALTACGGEGADDYAFKFGAGGGGPNVGINVLNAVRYEDGPKLLRVNGYSRVTCDGFNQSAAPPSPYGAALIRLIQGGLVFRNCRWQFERPKMLEFGTPPTGTNRTVRFDHCEFPYPADSGGNFPVGNVIQNPTPANCYYSFFRCDGPGHVPLPDAKNAW